MSGLKPKHAAFIRYFLGESAGNASQAAIKAGYSPRSAGSQAHDLLKNPKVVAALEAQQKALATNAGYTAERVISRLATIADAPLDLDKLRPGDQVKALELLGKAHQLFQDTDKGSDRITVNIGFMAQAPPHDTTRSVERQVLSSRPSAVVSRDTDETT